MPNTSDGRVYLLPPGAAVLSTLDANSGYFHVGAEEIDRDKTAFTFQHGLYRILQMPVGLKNAPETFQRTMFVIMSSI